MPLRALASVNVAAIERNVALLRARAGGAVVCAVVKADGYGHGAVPSALAALAGGARWLAVATAAEAVELREAEIDVPILVMGALSDEELVLALSARADLVVWSEAFVDAVASSPARAGAVRMHVKLDTGMGRLGTRDGAQALRVARAVLDRPGALELIGAMTHFATADGDVEFMRRQLAAFAPFVEEMRRRAPEVIVHAANSAATLREPASHFDMVRCGIAIYGCDPMNEDATAHGLEPALSLRSYVATVKAAHAGDSAGYGRRFVADRDTFIGTVPIGYGDGVSRRYTNDCDILIGGRRYPLVGTVSMDNVTVDLGPDPVVAAGDTAVLIGSDAQERQTAEDLARRLGTISYEVVCAISRRVPRAHHRDGETA
jgi:alanine racemase